jgi:hypothetical protein
MTTATSSPFRVTVRQSPLSDTPDYLDPVADVTLSGGRNTVDVANDAELASALAIASPGDTIRLGAGTYSADHTIDKSFSADNPLIVEGAASFASVMTGKVTMLGQHNIVTGLLFSGAGATVQIRGYNNKVIANKFTGRRGNMITPGNGNDPDPGSHCEIAYNEFYEPGDWDYTGPGSGSGPTEFRMAVRMTTGGNGQFSTVHLSGWLHHNYVHDFPDKPIPSNYSSGQSDSFELGEAAYDWNQTPIDWHVEDNVVQRHLQNGQASIIDIKSAGVVCRRNTALDSGTIRVDNRLGGQCIIEANWCGSISVHSIGNIVAGNVCPGVISCVAGDQPYDGFQSPGLTHQQCVDTLLTGNTGTIDLGRFAGGDQTYPALNTIIEDHTGGVQLTLESGTTDNRDGSSSRRYETAVEGSVADVGPDALMNAPSAYLAARVP